MGKIIERPRRPIENWEGRLDAWLSEVDAILEDAQGWAAKRDWATRIDAKRVSEDAFGVYEAPVLLIHSPQARFLLEPIAHNVVGASGRIELSVMPSYDGRALLKIDDGWRLYSLDRRTNELWSEESFANACDELAARA